MPAAPKPPLMAHDIPPSRTLKSLDDLAAAGLISLDSRAALAPVAARYAIAVTPPMTVLVDPANPDDPIGRQFVPTEHELTATPGESADPIGDARHEKVPGLVHRYPDRVLLKAVHVCPVYCRFCFRREMVGPEGLGTLSPEAMDAPSAISRAIPRSGR